MRIKEMIDQDIEIIRELRTRLLVHLGILKPVKVTARRDGKKPPQFLIKKTAGRNFRKRFLAESQ